MKIEVAALERKKGVPGLLRRVWMMRVEGH